MDDLFAFLRDRLDEDERVAQAALEGPREAGEPMPYGEAADHDAIAGPGHSGGGKRPQADHIARHEPARVLRDIESKRRILDELEGFIAEAEYLPEDERNADRATAFGIVHLLALPYDDHVDYREEWKP
ncbi:DUF6221 family protein [Nonomuraea sp. NPDC049152]|uniref:DUF6221 family protein n=1 Tax=Nonomuraea sp. NPDC049152 TaxID=3154350 RepID=UPI0033CC15BE